MHRRSALIVFAAGKHLKSFLQAIEPAAVEVVFEFIQRIAGAQMSVSNTMPR
jgi:hypothetical protein